MIRYRAAWLLPVAEPPIRDAWIEVAEERIVAFGTGPCADATDLGSVAILPGLVNAHTHLELSYLDRRIAPSNEFVDWIRQVVETRRTQPDAAGAEIMDAVGRGIAQAVASGTALVGDISNTLVTVEPLRRSALGGVVFHELIRFNPPDAPAVVDEACRQIDALPQSDAVRAALAAHAPYSVAPAVFEAIAAASARRQRPFSVHLAESRSETEFIARGTGPWRSFLDDVGAWNPEWHAAGTTPVQYLDRLQFLQPATLVVHGVQMDDADLRILKDRGTTLVTCPRSNAQTGAGTPSIDRFYASGVRVAVGTDSLASTPDLSVFAELAAMRRLAPRVPASRLIESATRHGADALGFGDDYGTVAPGKQARLLAVAIPRGLADVEEYLVGGIEPEAISWLDRSCG